IRSTTLFGSLLRSVQDNFGGVLERSQRTAREFYVATLNDANGPRHVTRLDVVLKSDPFEPASQATLDVLQTWLRTEMPRTVPELGDVEAECYGVTVSSRDLATVTEADRKRINMLVLAGIFLILLALVRKPWLAAYLLATVLFSYFVTLGAVT